MEIPYKNHIRQTWMPVSGYSLSLPLFFPSISSVKTNMEPFEYLRVLVSLNYHQFLISAYDIFFASEAKRAQIYALLQQASENEQIILLDSGNYEGYWKDNNSWNMHDFHQVLNTEPYDLAFCFDKQDEFEDVESIIDQIETSVVTSQEEVTKATIIPIIHGKQNILSEISLRITEKLHPVLLAIPERELGNGIIERSKTLLQIRLTLDKTGQYYPIHLLGTGNPLSILIYSICGADSFDGLEWCQTTVNHDTGLLYHFHQRELFQNTPNLASTLGLPYEHTTLIHNLMFYSKWMDSIHESFNNGTIMDMAVKYLGNPFCNNLLTQFSGVL